LDTNVDGLITLKENNDSGADISFDATINDEKTIITINPVNDFTADRLFMYQSEPRLKIILIMLQVLPVLFFQRLIMLRQLLQLRLLMV
jgi:hypothetical protein